MTDANVSQLDSLALLAVGMASPVGGCWRQTAASVRGGITRHQLLADPADILVGRTHEAFLPVLEESHTPANPRAHRCLQLALMALRDLYQNASIAEPLPLLLALPEPLAGVTAVGADLLQHLAVVGGFDIAQRQSSIYQYGRAGGLAALHGAFDLLERGVAKQVIIGGVDSWVDRDSLQALVASERVFTLGSTNGLVPGEAASFLLLGPDQPKGSQASLARIGRPGFAQQTSPPKTAQAATDQAGNALGDAVVAACGNAKVTTLRAAYPSTNGEPTQLDQWTQACRQLKGGTLAENLRLSQPFFAMGDVGAAFGPLLIGLATADLSAEPDRSPALITTASDTQYRAAVVVTGPN